jgi:two-component system response regulator DesR
VRPRPVAQDHSPNLPRIFCRLEEPKPQQQNGFLGVRVLTFGGIQARETARFPPRTDRFPAVARVIAAVGSLMKHGHRRPDAGFVPHVVLLDPQLPGRIRIEDLCRKLTGPGVFVLIDHEAIAATSLALVKQAPRIGLIATDATTDQLVQAIRDVAKGLPVVDVRLDVAALKAGDNPLTDRECEVLRQVTTGATAQEIARTLSLSAGTVRNYLSRILAKTGARSRIEAIRKAQDAGWI